MNNQSQVRTYFRNESAVFRKTAEAFGGLSNMASGYPIRINGVLYHTSEALYQACRFPHRPEVQKLIVGQHSPMTAKMKSKPYRKDSRQDWDQVRVKVMRWCLQVKLAQNWEKFSRLLLSTGDRPIVEDSRKDDYWGAKEKDEKTLAGMNVLGRLLMELREFIKQGKELRLVEPPNISNFLLFGEPVATIDFRQGRSDLKSVETRPPLQPQKSNVMPLFDYVAAPLPEYSPIISLESKHALVSGLQPYGEYKESGRNWIGKIPHHWTIRRTKYLLHEFDSRSMTGREQLLRVSQYSGVTPRHSKNGLDTPDTRASSLVGYKMVEVSDLVINIMLAWNGSLGIARDSGIVSPAYCVYRFQKEMQPWYFHHLLRTPLYKGRIKAVSTGVVESRLRLYSDDLGRLEAILPPPDEQSSIVRFLDHANRKIDRFIRAKRKMIALLNEQRQAIIHRAVTRGLDPDVRLKATGVPWLGDIPEHWDVRRIKQVAKILRGKFSHRPRNDASLYDGEYPFIQTGSVARAKKFISHYTQTLNEKGLSVSKLFPKGTLCMTIAANIGDVAILDFEACFPDSIVGFVPNNQLDRDFLYFVFRCMKDDLLREAPVNTQGNLNIERIGTKCIPFPKLAEQQLISKQVEMETASFDKAITRTEREIALMQEFRTRLTADVVAGKLDVREAAAKLPELKESGGTVSDGEEPDDELLAETDPEESDA